MEGVELRQLRHFLNESDRAGALGNLYKMVTSQGHVKWVCLDHFRTNYRESFQRAFVDNVQDNGGMFNEDLGTVQIELKSRTQAKTFYSALENARGVHDLDVTLSWECNMKDFRTLSSAIAKSVVVSLKLQCSADNPTAEILNSKRRHTPLIQLLAKSRLRSATFGSSPSILSRVDLSAIPESALHLRHLSLDIETIRKHSSEITLSRILQCCSALQSLRLGFLTHCTDEDLLILVRVAMKEGRTLRDLNMASPGWKSLSSLEKAVIQLQHDLVHDGSGNSTAFRRLVLEDFVDVAQATLKFDNDGAITPTAQLKSIILQEYQHDFREAVKGEQRKLFMQLKGHHLDSLAVVDERHLFPGIFLYILSAIEEHQGQSLLTSVFIRTNAMTLSCLDSLWSIIQKSPRLMVLKIEFNCESYHELTQDVLTRLGPFATEVVMSPDLSWLQNLRSKLDRSLLPRMTHLSLCMADARDTFYNMSLLLNLISMPAGSPSLSSASSSTGVQPKVIASLVQLEFIDFKFDEEDDGARLIRALDFSTLEYLTVSGSAFTHDDFGTLLNLIPFPDSSHQGYTRIALKGLAVIDTAAEKKDDEKESWRQQLLDKAPGVDFVTQYEISGAEKRFGPLALGCSERTICWAL